jgi:hypothetical protein
VAEDEEEKKSYHAIMRHSISSKNSERPKGENIITVDHTSRKSCEEFKSENLINDTIFSKSDVES